MTSIALALGAALGWGSADFFAGVSSRTVSALVVLWSSQLLGLALVAVTALFVGLDTPAGSDLLLAAGAGVALTVGLAALYRAMAVGRIAVAAPIAATGVAIPVAVGLAGGDDPTLLQSLGVVLAAAGILLCSSESSPSAGRATLAAGVGLALLGALGGGLNAALLAGASSAGVLWVLLIQRGVVGVLALGLLTASRRSVAPPRRVLPAVVTVGVLDLLGTGAFTAATINGELSLVAVVGALYPVVTVMLAFAVLSDRLAPHQLAGAVAALAGVAAIAGG
ncbi:EamA/RhaT family transporter [Thermoleophilia bacterium SCSIO 60948]|nr:EamA/RhaT family transporter [Thermoleophilia bacterium SCSIO 60948]